ncbi:MAG: TonB-dependent receptor [Myxococcota bacterium]
MRSRTVGRSKLPRHGAKSVVSREDIERRLPRSTPDALRYEPGVFVQQSAHSQGSVFLRGLTGEQTLLLFDGIRLNNSTYRQGPNQYFFTLDSQSIDHIEIVRGGASTRYGSDALGGVILAQPVEPLYEKAHRIGDAPQQGLLYEPRVRVRTGTADREIGGRAQTHLGWGSDLSFFGGVGARTTSELEGGGRVRGQVDPLKSPRLRDDGRTQIGTGFDEVTADGAVVYRLSASQRIKLAVNTYLQFNAPRTDLCPPSEAVVGQCFEYDEQFRTLAYGVWEGRGKHWAVDTFRSTLSWQRQRERTTQNQPDLFTRNIGRDVVDTLGVTLTASSRRWDLGESASLSLRYGIDNYYDLLQSAAWQSFSNTDQVVQRSRGQYLDGSRYLYGGTFLDSTWVVWDGILRIYGGGRLSWIEARTSEDTESGSGAVLQRWFPVVGHAGVEFKPVVPLSLLLNVDRSFRAPNLNDMTARQQTGPGFQFENAALGPEHAMTMELGMRYGGVFRAELWAFYTVLDGAIAKSPRNAQDCPANTPQCNNSRNQFKLVNSEGHSVIRGVESALAAEGPWGLRGRATLSWTWGEGPRVSERQNDPSLPPDERVPLSRIPPLNGSVEAEWRHDSGVSLSGALRWAAGQDRLAEQDFSDARIPVGGTPGFTVMDVRGSYRFEERFTLSMAFENVFDAAYRYHGSSVNGAGRGLIVLLDVGLGPAKN